jgi:hypothetical protein
MKKLLSTVLLLITLLSAATPEQVEHYLMLSHSEEDLLELEAGFSAMQNRMDARDGNTSTYDTEMLTVRFREQLQKALSESEMTKVLENYKSPALLKFFYESSDPEGDFMEIRKYAKESKENPERESHRLITEKINTYYSNKEAIAQMFDALIVPIMKRMKSSDSDEERLKEMKENYLKSMINNGYNQILYATREFSTEELDELLEIAKTPAMGYETKAVFGAMAYAMQEFMEQMADRMGHRKK